ncbi:MAG TPA: glycosyltransferase [Gemmataceae bacterium]|nr:glycosyltransferase [Gemmataceae bacterium]
MTVVAHLTASTLYGGPERQMLGLGHALAGDCRSLFLSFAEGGRSRAFVEEARRQGFEADALAHDTPHLRGAVEELAHRLREAGADLLCCHGYKADLLGRVAARRCQVPAIAVSRGWTGECRRVRLYEALDRLHLRWMDRVVCVSEGQARKVRRAGVRPERIVVIRNAIRTDRFDRPDPGFAERLCGLFAERPRRIVGAAGRLSPEKGFGVLVEAAGIVLRADPSVGFVLFGDGPLRQELSRQIDMLGLRGRFVLGGFRRDLDGFMPFFDLLVLPSFTEGLPNVVLEGQAAGVPVVATAVGGTPEVIADGVTGHLVPPGDPLPLARRTLDLLGSDAARREMGRRGRRHVAERFTFEAQAAQYRRLFDELSARVPEEALA